MADARRLTWSMDFNDRASEGIGSIDKKFSGAAKAMESFGKGMTKKVTAPLVAVGAASIKTVANFDDGMSRVRGLTGATGQDFDKLRDKAIQLGNDTAFSATEASEGMQVLAAAGMDVNDILETSGDMFTLMSAGAVDAETSASVLTNTMAQFNVDASESGRIIDTFAKGAASAKLGVADLEHIMGVAGGSMASMNMDMEQSVAMAGQLANAGMPIGQVGSALNAMGREMKANAKQFKKLGVEVYDSSGELKDMGSIMEGLEKQLKGKTDAQRDAALSTVFSGQAMKAATDWLSKGSDEYNTLTKAIHGSAGAAEEMARINEDNIGGAFRSLSSSIGTLMINIGDVLKEPIKELADGIGRVTEKFNGLSPEAQKTIVTLGAVAAAIGPVVWGVVKVGTAISKFGALIMKGAVLVKGAVLGVAAIFGVSGGLVVGVIAGIVAIGVVLVRNWDNIKAKASEIGEGIANTWNVLKSRTAEAWENIKNTITEKIEGIKSAWQGVKDFMSAPVTGTVNAVKKGAGWVADKVSGGKTDGRHRTGLSRVPRDGYRAELHKNEEVLRANDPRNINNSKTLNRNVIEMSAPISVVIEGNASEADGREIANQVRRQVEFVLDQQFKKLSLQGV